MKHLLAGALVLSGCVAASQSSTFAINYETRDAPTEERVYVKYRNTYDQDVCLYPANWPEADGKIDSGKGRVFIVVDDTKYSTQDFDSGYCPTCLVRVEPGKEAVSHFNYRDFDLPSAFYSRPKSLDFTPIGASCPKIEHKR